MIIVRRQGVGQVHRRLANGNDYESKRGRKSTMRNL